MLMISYKANAQIISEVRGCKILWPKENILNISNKLYIINRLVKQENTVQQKSNVNKILK